MSAPMHTPGPWRWAVDDEGENLSIDGPNNEFVIGGCGCCGSPFTVKESAEANARLIAAAPELLRCGEDIARAAEALVQAYILLGSDGDHLAGVRAIIANMNAAIAKAKGEA